MSKTTAIVGLTLVNAVWGLSFPIMKAANLVVGSAHGYSPKELEAASGDLFVLQAVAFLIAVRFALAFVFLLIAAPSLYREPKRDEWRCGSAMGATFVLGLLLQCAGLNTIDASRSGFLTSLAVLFTPWFVMVLTFRLPTLQIVLSSAIALTGTAILTDQISINGGVAVTGDWSRLRIGDFQTLLSAALFAVQIILLDRFGKTRNAARFTPAMFATAASAATIFFVVSLFIRRDEIGVWLGLFQSPAFWVLLIPLVVFCSVVAFVGMNRFQPHVSAEQAAVIYTLEPIFATLWAMCLPFQLSWATGIEYANESPGWSLVIGGALVALANVVGLWPRGGNKNPERAANLPVDHPHESLTTPS